ncbi:flagellin [Marinobacter sp. CHS3-4]|uniref:flagellin N-terminal helical domain-containing protein n=1 Tax=Marinobacter sp. CHS3-4 TaxID=3045174 RepID=UPI0024B55CEF|nr:flagellin [Marinobacter sp. CHS3-4]MDI9245015.1 flagellin [Marinobacter sp. CHS3-4]
MALGINTNVASLSAQNQLNKSQELSNQALERLSSGLRINSAKDDAAGLAISTRFSAQISGLNQAVRNANDGISLAQTAEGALSETVNSLARIRELAVQSANDTNSASDRASLQEEVDQLLAEVNRIADTTQFNGQNVLDGSFTAASFQVGANAGQTIGVSIDSARANQIGNFSLTTDGTGSEAVAAATDPGASTVVDAEDLTLTGSLGTTTVAVGAGDSARSIAESVNAATGSTGIKADASTQARIEGVSTGTVSFDLTGQDGTAVTVSAQVDDSSNVTSLADAINAASTTTGITAELSADRSSITLTSEGGDDILIADASNNDATDNNVFDVQGLNADGTDSGSAVTLADVDNTDDGSGTDSTRISGDIEFNSSESFTVTSGSTGGLFAATSNSATLSAASEIDITSQSGASSAINVVDGALDSINSLRATLGAVQSRFESTISNLSTTAENLSAANSRILDADFAAETAKLSKAQVLQQAGISVLAQANARPQQVLSLLQ